MAHYAKVVDGKVTNVIVAEAEYFDTFVDDSPGTWVQTSYNTRGGVHYKPNSDTPSDDQSKACLLYTSPSPRDRQKSRMPSSA